MAQGWHRLGHDHPDDAQIEAWIADPSPSGGLPFGKRGDRLVPIDAEEAGAAEPLILAALNTLPDTCRRPSLSGIHGYVMVEGEYPDHPLKLAEHPPPGGRTAPILLAEARLARATTR